MKLFSSDTKLVFNSYLNMKDFYSKEFFRSIKIFLQEVCETFMMNNRFNKIKRIDMILIIDFECKEHKYFYYFVV